VGLGIALGLLACGDRAGDLGRPAQAPPGELGSAASGLAPYTFGLPPIPEGTVARAGGEPIKLGDPAAWTSPFTAPSAQDLARGRELFRIYCGPCHGPQGHGDGPMATPLGVTVRDLRDEAVTGLTDGEIYATITRGSGQMLGLRGLVAPADRWLIVLGLRAITRESSAAHEGLDATSPDSTPPAATSGTSGRP
jgi:mono/diheme cytochrome c family protein